jgi:hypothetical protein
MPIGALTSKPYAFVGRPWELVSKINYDFTDTYSSPINLDFRGSSLTRVRPFVDSVTMHEWLTDRIRFSYDNFRIYNNLVLYFRREALRFSKIWIDRFLFSRFYIFNFNFQFCTLNLLDTFSFSMHFPFSGDFDFRYSYYFDYSVPLLKNIIFVNLLPRYVIPLHSINFRRSGSKNFNIFSFGPFLSNNLNELNLGSSFSSFKKFLSFGSKFNKFLLPSNTHCYLPISFFDIRYYAFTKISFSGCQFNLAEIGLKNPNHSFSSLPLFTFGLNSPSYFNDFSLCLPHPFYLPRIQYLPTFRCHRYVDAVSSFVFLHFNLFYKSLSQVSFSGWLSFSPLQFFSPSVFAGVYKIPDFFFYSFGNFYQEPYISSSKFVTLYTNRINNETIFLYFYFYDS